MSILYALNGESTIPALHAQHIAQYVYSKLAAAKDYDEMGLLAKTINARLKLYNSNEYGGIREYNENQI